MNTSPSCRRRCGLTLVEVAVAVLVCVVVAGTAGLGWRIHQHRADEVEVAETLLRYTVDLGRIAYGMPQGYDTPAARSAASPRGLRLVAAAETDEPGTAVLATGANGRVATVTAPAPSGRCVSVTTLLGSRSGASTVQRSSQPCRARVPASTAGLPSAPEAPEERVEAGGFRVLLPAGRLVDGTLVTGPQGSIVATDVPPEGVGEQPSGRLLYRTTAETSLVPVLDTFNRPVLAPEQGRVTVAADGSGVAFTTSRQLGRAAIAEGSAQLVVATPSATSVRTVGDRDGTWTFPAGAVQPTALTDTAVLVRAAAAAAPDGQDGWWQLATGPVPEVTKLPFDADELALLSADGRLTAGTVGGRLVTVTAEGTPTFVTPLPAGYVPVAVGSDGTVAAVALTVHGRELIVTSADGRSSPVVVTTATVVLAGGDVWFVSPHGLVQIPAAALTGPDTADPAAVGRGWVLPDGSSSAGLRPVATTAGTVIATGPASQLASGCRSLLPLTVQITPDARDDTGVRLRLDAGSC